MAWFDWFRKKTATTPSGATPHGHPGPGSSPPVASLDLLEDAYLVRHDPALQERVSAALDQVARSQGGASALLARLSQTVTVSAGKARVADHGDMTWNELLKVREIVRALGRAKSTDSVPVLAALLQADCDYGQFLEIVQPALARALGEIGTTEALATLKGALTRSNVPVDTTRAIQEALDRAAPAQAFPVGSLVDIGKRATTSKIGCIAFRLKDANRSSSLRSRLDAAPLAAAGTPARIDAIFAALLSECSVERPYVYETSFSSAWSKVYKGDVVMVVDFEAKWSAFEKKMQAQNYTGEPALLKAVAVNARALDLTVQFLSPSAEVMMTL